MFFNRKKEISPALTVTPDKYSIENISQTITELSARAKELGDCFESVGMLQLVIPFLNAFGWNLTDPSHGTVEKNAGGKNRADIMLIHNCAVKIVIEVKRPYEKLAPHIPQLSGYFNNSKASIGILTNGIEYWFFSYSEYKSASGTFMNEAPFARVSIDNISLAGKDAFLAYLRKKDFNDQNLIDYSNADYTRNKIYGLIKGAHGAAVDDFVRQAFNIVNPGYSPQRITDLINFTNYHSRWNYRHGKEDR